MLLLGGTVRGGLYGSPPSLTDLPDGDLRFEIDFRTVYAGALEQWLGPPAAPVVESEFTPLALRSGLA